MHACIINAINLVVDVCLYMNKGHVQRSLGRTINCVWTRQRGRCDLRPSLQYAGENVDALITTDVRESLLYPDQTR